MGALLGGGALAAILFFSKAAHAATLKKKKREEAAAKDPRLATIAIEDPIDETQLAIEAINARVATEEERKVGTLAVSDEWVLVEHWPPNSSGPGHVVTNDYDASPGPIDGTVFLPKKYFDLYQNDGPCRVANRAPGACDLDRWRIYQMWWWHTACGLPGLTRMPGAVRHAGAHFCTKVGFPTEPGKYATWAAKEAKQAGGWIDIALGILT